MFDEDCYQQGYAALDREFKDGRYYVVSDPTMPSPTNKVIHLQDKRDFRRSRGGSSDNLLMEDHYHSTSNGYHGPRGHREMDYDDREWYDHKHSNNNNNNYNKVKSMNNLHYAHLHSPKSDDLNRRRDQESSYEYYRKYGGPASIDHHPRHRFAKEASRYDSISSGERSAYSQPHQQDSYLRSFSNDTESSDDVIININRGMGLSSKQIPRIANEEHMARSWDSRTYGGRKWGETGSYGSQGRLGSQDTFIREKPLRHVLYSNNNNNSNNYRNGNVLPIRVERTESSGTSNMSMKDYWEGRWSSGSGDDQGRFANSPSLSANRRRNISQNLSTDNLYVSSNGKLPSVNNERLRMDSRIVYDGVNSQKPPRPSPKSTIKTDATSRTDGSTGDKEFLSKVQQELEFQRKNLTGEIDKMLAPMGTEIEKARSPIGSPSISGGLASPTFNAEKNSFVDTSGPSAIFKAFVDVNEYPPSSVNVSVDQLGNKVVVEASQSESSKSNIATSFTQKIPLPRYADITSMSAKLNRKGVLKIEVPLLFYFPSDHQKSSTTTSNALGKSFVYEVKTDARNGSKVMEIIVKPGSEVTLNEVRVEVSDDGQLSVYVERQTSNGGKDKKIIKTYSLPESAILTNISSRMANDGTLTISVPISAAARGTKR